MAYHRVVARATVVDGYVHGVDVQPRAAREAGLSRRVALILQTEDVDGEPVYRPAGYERWLDAAIEVTGADALRVVDPDSRVTFENALAEARAEITRWQDDPPLQVSLLRGGALVGVVRVDFWNRIGGPAPYHDEYAVALFTAQDVSDEMAASIGPWVQRLAGEAAPPPVGWLSRLLGR